MKFITFLVALFLSCMTVFAQDMPSSVQHFSSWISDVEYDATNDSYRVRYAPAANRHVYIMAQKYPPYQKIQPGETYLLARGKYAVFTQFVGSGCTVTFTNGIDRVGEVELPKEFSLSQRQFVVSVKRRLGRDHKCEECVFIVNADGEAYDVTTRQRFHFGIPFHAHYEKAPPRLSRSMENIQRAFCEEGEAAYKKALSETNGSKGTDAPNEGGTNAVSFIWETGGVGNISERVKESLIKREPDNARIFALLEANRSQDRCVAFFTKENGMVRVAAVARAFDKKEWHFWTYSSSGTPEFVFLGNGRGTAENYYEYSADGKFRNFCLISKRGINYHTVIDGVLQKSSDMQKAQEFVAKVEGIFNRYVELDTTGILKKLNDGR